MAQKYQVPALDSLNVAGVCNTRGSLQVFRVSVAIGFSGVRMLSACLVDTHERFSEKDF